MIDAYGPMSFWANDGYIHCDKQLMIISRDFKDVRILTAMILRFTQRGRIIRAQIRVRFYRV